MSDSITIGGAFPLKRGPAPRNGTQAKTRTQYRREWKERKRQERLTDIAILDFETDPFDNTRPDDLIYPFAACLYRDDAKPVIIWDENFNAFVAKVMQAIRALPRRFTIYAHNGGKFDFMFFLHEIRGSVKFKGRGIMSASIGPHELRDSFHIIPERLASYRKDDFDYTLLRKGKRALHRATIIEYMTNDCRYLLEIVKDFVQQFGFKISIGQAAIGRLRQHYSVKRISEYQDGGTDGKGGLRRYFFGGRVECLAGKGHFAGHYKLYDVNSMYPAVMANCLHPIGNEYAPRRGDPTAYTAFVQITCNNYGAFVRRGENGETSADFSSGEFFVSKHEFDMASRLGLIDNVEIIQCIDCEAFSNFAKFVVPLYENRLRTKDRLKYLTSIGMENTREWHETKREDIFYKLLLNNCYGKFAQNPRRFKDTIITDLGMCPEYDPENPWPELPSAETEHFALWERPSLPYRFFNVGTGASITGAARAVLMEAIENASDPIYCDTDSIICRDLRNLDIDPVRLGAWDIEANFSEVLIAGKKTYATRGLDGKEKVKSKGVEAVTWDEVQRIIDGEIIEKIAKGPTLSRFGTQSYMRRNIRATAPRLTIPTYREGKRNGYYGRLRDV